MPELSRSFAYGLVASLLAASSAFALDASTGGAANPDMQQAVALVSGGVAAKPADDPALPKVELAPDGDSRRADGAQATLDGLARDCANLGAEMICKVALVGEGARKKGGSAAAIDAPMTIQVKDGDGREIETRRINLKVEMPEGVQKVSFRHVEENVSLPPATAAGYGGWTIVVGLEPGEASVAEADDGEIEQPAVAPRSKSSKRSRSARAKAVRQARGSAARRAQQPAQLAGQQTPGPQDVPVSARPLAAPAAVVTTTTTGGAMARAAQGFTERRDAALQTQRAQAAQAAAQARRPGQAAPAQAQARPQQAAPRQVSRGAAPQPQAAAPAQPSLRTANR